MDANKKAIADLKDWWAQYKNVVIGWTIVILSVTVILQRHGLKQHNQFLIEHNLEDFYYYPDEH